MTSEYDTGADHALAGSVVPLFAVASREGADYLHATAARFRAMEDEVSRRRANSVAEDIAACRVEAEVGFLFAMEVDRIEAELKKMGGKLDLHDYCKQWVGVSLRTMQRRKRLKKHWDEYERKRRDLGECGYCGLELALALIMGSERSGRSPSLDPKTATTTGQIPNLQLITGDSRRELRKLTTGSVDNIVASPPYWPPRRHWTDGIGNESTLEEWIENVVDVMRGCRPVLKDSGTAWLNVADSYAKPQGVRGLDQKQPASAGVSLPDSTTVAPAGNLLFVPERLAMALQRDGWIVRSRVVWQKTNYRPENIDNRPIINVEMLFVLAKRPNHYYFDGDLLRLPPRGFGKVTPGRWMKRDGTKPVFYPNPLGCDPGCVWVIRPSNYRGPHKATMPLQLAELCIMAGCPENGVVLDPFGGAGTTALAALLLGRQAISIDINPEFSREAHTRIAAALGLA